MKTEARAGVADCSQIIQLLVEQFFRTTDSHPHTLRVLKCHVNQPGSTPNISIHQLCGSNYFTSLNLSCLICEMGIMRVVTFRLAVRIK